MAAIGPWAMAPPTRTRTNLLVEGVLKEGDVGAVLGRDAAERQIRLGRPAAEGSAAGATTAARPTTAAARLWSREKMLRVSKMPYSLLMGLLGGSAAKVGRVSSPAASARAAPSANDQQRGRKGNSRRPLFRMAP